MNDSAEQAQIEAATTYESLFVPALFEQWTAQVADAAGIQPGQRVLDVACGTGVLARHVARRIGTSGTVTGLDPSPGMLAVADRHAPAVDWRRGTAESLPFDAGSFDAVVSQFGLMFFTDRAQAVREMMRVLTPGGRLAVAVWDSLENNPAYAAEVDLLTRLAGRAPADALRAPFMLGDREVLAKVFEDAGVRPIDITTHAGIARFPNTAWSWRPTSGLVADGRSAVERRDHRSRARCRRQGTRWTCLAGRGRCRVRPGGTHRQCRKSLPLPTARASS